MYSHLSGKEKITHNVTKNIHTHTHTSKHISINTQQTDAPNQQNWGRGRNKKTRRLDRDGKLFVKFGRVVCVVKWKFDNIACELIRVWNWRMETYFLSSNCTLTNTVFILLDTYIFFFQINDNGCCCFCWLVDDVKFFPLINPFEMVIQFGIEQIVF